jgi:hypothetical protein
LYLLIGLSFLIVTISYRLQEVQVHASLFLVS